MKTASEEFPPRQLITDSGSSSTLHDRLWSEIAPDEAGIVRAAMIAAQSLREQNLDPGDAYLRGLAVGLTASRQILANDQTAAA